MGGANEAVPVLIRMDRPHLEELPPRPIIPGRYVLETYSDDLFDRWLDLLEAAFPEHQFARDAWRQKVVPSPRFMPNGAFYVREIGEDELCATAYAWRESPEEDPGLARVEWVGVRPSHRGRKLGRLMMDLVLHFMAEQGFDKVTLDTEPYRLPAVSLYLSLGFTPAPRNDEERLIWDEVLSKLVPPG